jgi:methionine biosynthesis protein MetW
MPVTRSLPVSWHETPNIHFCTIMDFADLARDMGLVVEEARFLARGAPVTLWPNLLAETAVYVIRRQG